MQLWIMPLDSRVVWQNTCRKIWVHHAGIICLQCRSQPVWDILHSHIMLTFPHTHVHLAEISCDCSMAELTRIVSHSSIWEYKESSKSVQRLCWHLKLATLNATERYIREMGLPTRDQKAVLWHCASCRTFLHSSLNTAFLWEKHLVWI